MWGFLKRYKNWGCHDKEYVSINKGIINPSPVEVLNLCDMVNMVNDAIGFHEIINSSEASEM
jgi:hypothetical protein